MPALSLRTLIGLAAPLLLALPAAPANAGTYEVYSCADKAGTSFGSGGWTAFGAGAGRRVKSACPSGSLTAQLRGTQAAGRAAGWRFDAAPGTEIAGYTIWRSAQIAKPAGGAVPGYYLAWPGPLDGPDTKERCFGTNCRTLGRGRSDFDRRRRLRAPGAMGGVRALNFVVSCAGQPGKRCRAKKGKAAARLDIHGARITLRDDHTPAITGLGGPLTERTRVQAGDQTVTVAAQDVGGGVATALLEIDGRPFAMAPFSSTCHEPYTTPAPCPTSGTATVTLNTRILPNGPHAMRVIVADPAGNAVATGSSAFNTDNSASAALAASINYRWRSSSEHTSASRLSVTDVAPGTEIELRCEGGSKRRCPFTVKELHARISGSRDLMSSLNDRHLRPGARLRVRVTGLDGSVKLASFRVRSTDTPDATFSCRPGTTTDYNDCP